MRAAPTGPPPLRRTAICASAPSLRPAAAAVAREAPAPRCWGGCRRSRPSSPLPGLGRSEGLSRGPL
eukprot:10613704-Alexandrium_andersonii.AAC.1